MDYQGSVYYYDGYSNFMKGKIQFRGEDLEADSGARRDWFVGYRHAMEDHHCRVKRELDNFAHQFDSSSQQFESLATKQDEGWNGAGLPPVGCECERETPRGWSRCKINYLSSKVVVYQMLETGNEYASTLSAYRFRPIRTEAEIRREDTKNAIAELCRASASNGHSADLIYDAIAAGKIPHINLESDYE